MENKNEQVPVNPEKNGPDTGPDTGTFVFDTASGFSVDEQQEILDQINSLSVEKGLIPQDGVHRSEAKKRGVVFPILVNIAAILLLAGGFFTLWSFHSRDEQGIRLGSAALGLTERKLIQEIRRETIRKLSEKENEISKIQKQLEDAENEYRQLERSMETLTWEQMARAEYLISLREEYQLSLSYLLDERTMILEDARLKESGLRAQAAERSGESSQIDQSSVVSGEAMDELARLSNEQEKAAAAEAQLSGFYTAADRYINSGEFAEAANTLARMKEFLENPVFINSRSMESRKQMHLTVIDTMENAVTSALQFREASEALRVGSGGSAEFQLFGPEERASLIDDTAAPLRSRISELEKAVDAQQRIITVLNSQDSTQSQIIAEYDNMIGSQQNTISDLRSQIASLQNVNSSQQQSLNQRESINADLGRQVASLEQRIVQLNTTATARDQEISQLNTAVSSRDQRINQLNTTVESRDRQVTQLNAAAESRERQITQLNATVTARDQQITQLNAAVTSRDQQISQLGSEAESREHQITQLNDTAASRDQQISQLNAAVTSRDQQITQLNTAVESRDRQITQLNNNIASRDQQIAQLTSVSDSQVQQITQLTAAAASRDQQITQLNAGVTSRDQQITQLNNTNSQLQSHIFELGQSYDNLHRQINLIPSTVEQAIENPNVQALLGPQARRELLSVIQQAIQQVTQ